MKKVLEYILSNKCILSNTNGYSIEKKENGHYGLFGEFGYERDNITFGVSCNNETMIFKCYSKESDLKIKSVGHYHYLQTYKHINRGEPDKNGYYKRSTEDEVIKYIKYLQTEMLKTP